jgi:hypothetical protein
MTSNAVDSWADQDEILPLLRQATQQMGALLIPGDEKDCLTIIMPDRSAQQLIVSGVSAFPIVVRRDGVSAALPASRDSQAIAAALTRLPGDNPDIIQLMTAVQGWAVVTGGGAGSGAVTLARTEQGMPGWMRTAELRCAGGLVTLSAATPLPACDPVAEAAISHLLRQVTGLVRVQRVREANSSVQLDSVQFDLVALSAALTAAHIKAALAMIGQSYRALAPVVTALASVQGLAAIYTACQRLDSTVALKEG